MKKTTKPIIGLTLDYETGGGYSKMPWYAIRENYCSAVSTNGGVAIPLPHDKSAAAEYFSMIDGLIITGGAFDVDPSMFGESTKHETVTTKQNRTEFEWAITKLCIENNKPILGICGGEQLLNVVLGGTLIQHIPDTILNALEHEQKNPRTEPGHVISISSGTMLHNIVGCTEMNVNTAHHQAVAKLAKNVICNATTTDGVIEGIEYTNHPFCLGVQWHPEYFVDAGDKKIFEAFIAASAPR